MCQGWRDILGTDHDIVKHVARIGVVAISAPSTLGFGLAPIPGIGNEEFVGDTEIQLTLPILIYLTHPMRAKD